MQKLGMIGLGLLGRAIAERCLQAGYHVAGFDIAADSVAAFAAAGGTPVESSALAAESSDVLVLCLPDSDVVGAVVAALGDALRPGTLVVDTTTGRPEDAVALADCLAANGVEFVDATIAGSSAQVRAAQAIVMAGGPAASVERAAELLSLWGRQVFHVGPWGAAARMKLVVNLVLGLNRAVLAEGLTLARALGLDQAAMLDVLRAGPAYSTVMDTKGPKMLSGDFSPQARLSQHAKDVRLILESAAAAGVRLPLSQIHQQLLAQAESLGLGPLDNSAILSAYQAGFRPAE